MQAFDFLIVGAGITGAVLAERLTKAGFKVMVAEKRPHIGGNLHCETIEGITVHRYGAHIFHTSDKRIWDYVNHFAKFSPFINSPVANYKGELFNLPFNMNTFYQMFGVSTPAEAMAAIKEQAIPNDNPHNLEEQVLSMVGTDVYRKLIKGYTEKQWGKPCTELPPEIIKRIPLRFTFDNNYFTDTYQGIPTDGYDALIESILSGIPCVLNVDYTKAKGLLDQMAKRVIYTGAVDELFSYCYGALEYRSLRFEDEVLREDNHQGVAVVNYTDAATPFTRVIEHKHFVPERWVEGVTVCTREYPAPYEGKAEPYYPIQTDRNLLLHTKYKLLASKEDIVLCGRLAEYRYYDMDDAIASAMKLAEELTKRSGFDAE